MRLALDALAGTPVSNLAADHLVSRQFVYRQLHRAQAGLETAFDPPEQPDGLLFWLPVTKPWLRQLVLGLVLICHSSYRGVTELPSDLFDQPLSIGTVHNILVQATEQAGPINDAVDLSAMRIGVHDEIFQSGAPVLVGADARSGYCYLLSAEAHCDADTWGVRLLELQDRGFAPDATIADFGTALRAGQKQALPEVPCRADIFHPLYDFRALSTWLDERGYDALSYHEELSRKRLRYERRNGWKNRSLGMKVPAAGREAQKAMELADEVRTLLLWWQKDIVAVAGDDVATRQRLHDWIVEELMARASRCGRIKAVRTLLQNHSDELLAFAFQLDSELARLAGRFEVSVAVVARRWRCSRWTRRGRCGGGARRNCGVNWG